MAAEPRPAPAEIGEDDLALVLTGGGARAAYQIGVLAWLAEHYPELDVPILTGVSAGAVNAAYLASRRGSFAQAVEELVSLWQPLTAEQVFRPDVLSLAKSVGRWGLRLVAGRFGSAAHVRSFLDTSPLRALLEEVYACVDGELTGIDYNLHRGALKAVGISTTSYTTGQSVVWVQGQEVEAWSRPQRRSIHTRITVDHVMASSAIPLFFPAIRIDGAWYGDGGIRLVAPLSPALHLGARRILAVSTRYGRTQRQIDQLPSTHDYPPPVQVFGVLMNAVFLDLIDQDALRLERMNRLLDKLPPDQREGMRHIDLLVIRPSRDLGRLVRAYEPRLPWAFRFMTRGLGTTETRNPDLLSMLMFQPDYLRRLIELGRADAQAQRHAIERFIEREPPGVDAIPAD